MPGIVGLISLTGSTAGKRGTPHEETLSIMAGAMLYEPSYVCRIYHNSHLGIHVAWTGESSMAGVAGPVADRERGWILFPSGTPGVPTGRTGGDGTASWLAGNDGRNSIGLPVGGLFAGCLVDERRRQCRLFADHFGIERIFTCEDGETLLFSSEAKAILAVAPEARGFDPEGLGQYLTGGCTVGETTLYRGIRVLLPGTVVRYEKGTPLRVLTRPAGAAAEEPGQTGEGDYLATFCGTLKEILSEYGRLPLRAAVSLTGGLDSRMIMACLEGPEGAVPCYTFGSMYRDTYDVRAGREVARQCGQPHSVLVLDDDFLSGIQDTMNRAVFISDGYLGLSGAAELYLNRRAKSTAPLRITGNYGGELLRGVRAFKRVMPKGDFLKADFRRLVETAAGPGRDAGDAGAAVSSLDRQMSAGYGRYVIERSQVTVLSPFLDARMAELIDRMPHRLRGGNDFCVRVIRACRPSLCDIATDRGLLGTGRGPVRTLRRLYREALFRLEYWTGQGLPDGVSRMSRFGADLAYETLFRGRHKFQHFRTWMQNEIAACVESLLDGEETSALRDVIDSARVRDMFIDHRAGRRNFAEELDRIMTLILAERLLLKSGPRRPPHGGVPPERMPDATGPGAPDRAE